MQSVRTKDDSPDCIAQLRRFYKDRIAGNTVTSMQEPTQIAGWEPEPFQHSDPFADERENADLDYLASDTVVMHERV
jgi:hypothetical protein